jgi:hypothetical protein
MGLMFDYEGRAYEGDSAADVVRAMARDSGAPPDEAAEVRAFVAGALGRLADRVHMRELSLGRPLSEEATAFNFLCLLDEYGVGRLRIAADPGRKE